MDNTCIYLHINPITGDIFYVGIGNIDRPYIFYNRNKFWKRVVKKYGIIINICEINLSWEEACDKEINLIKIIGRRDLNLGTLCNLTDGGDGQKNPSEETRLKIGKTHKGKILSIEHRLILSDSSKTRWSNEEYKEFMRDRFTGDKNPFYGKTHTKENREKIRNSRLGKKAKPESIIKRTLKQIKPIFSIDKEGNRMDFESTISAIKFLNRGNTSCICACLRNVKPTAYGYKWYYKEKIK